jgi:hypothetical protein
LIDCEDFAHHLFILTNGFDRYRNQYEKIKSIHDSSMADFFAIDPSFEHRFRSFARYQTRFFGIS